MSSFQLHLNSARRRLLFPTQASCSDGILSPYCVDVIDELVTKRNNAHEPHLLATGTLNIVAGQTTYSINNIAPNYGKARYLYTKNTDNSTSFQRLWVDLVSLENLTEQYRGGDNFGVVPNSSAPIISAAAAVYYDINHGNRIEVAPIPQQAIAYNFIYEPATNRPTSKQSSGFTLTQFDALVAAKTAFLGLNHCQWRGFSRAEAKERRAEIRASLLYEIGSPDERRGLEYLLWQYNLTSYQRTNDTTTGFLQGKLY